MYTAVSKGVILLVSGMPLSGARKQVYCTVDFQNSEQF